jgi:hypothetical protein
MACLHGNALACLHGTAMHVWLACRESIELHAAVCGKREQIRLYLLQLHLSISIPYLHSNSYLHQYLYLCLLLFASSSALSVLQYSPLKSLSRCLLVQLWECATSHKIKHLRAQVHCLCCSTHLSKALAAACWCSSGSARCAGPSCGCGSLYDPQWLLLPVAPWK